VDLARRTLTEDALRRAVLSRQLLLERSSLPLPRVLERVAGLQTQYAPSGYIGLWSRTRSFTRTDLTRALERRAVVQATLMRSTIHLVSARDYWPIVAGVREGRREWWLRTRRGRVAEGEMEAAAAQVRTMLADRPQRRVRIVERLATAGADWNGVGLWVDLIRMPPSGTWEQRRADLYELAERWLAPEDVPPDRGALLLVRRYLAAFGPAPLADAANWAGLRPGRVAEIAHRLPLRRFLNETGGELVDLPRAPLPGPETPVPVRFLPTFDATLLGHARRTQILPERFRERVFNTKMPQSVPTFLVNGQVAGTWRHDGRRVVTSPFEPLPATARRELADEAARLAAFLA
jgi:hypothetical protein